MESQSGNVDSRKGWWCIVNIKSFIINGNFWVYVPGPETWNRVEFGGK